jgi:V-type H+-transporting ATPase subunit D
LTTPSCVTTCIDNEKVANKKQRDTAAADAEMKAKRAAQAEKDGKGADAGDEDNKGTTDLLAADEDEDVIF